MEVLISYPHPMDTAYTSYQPSISSQACGNAVSLKHPTPPSTENTVNGCDDDAEENNEKVSERGLDKEEKDSDADEDSAPVNSSKNTKKDKEKAQIDYLLSSLPAVKRFFNVHGKIGEGTFSSVFLASLKDIPAENPLANRQFAVKHLIPTTHPTRAERELKCLQDIGGFDNVVGVHFCMRYNDSIAFIMPYLPHKRFHEYVMDMGVSETRNYMKQLLLALRRVHSFNIIHRDVKPSNFLYDRETKQFLLVDFGLSQPVEETSKISSNPNLTEDTRKRKREKDQEEQKYGSSFGMCENPAKRPALALKNSTNIIKTPETMHKGKVDIDVPYKSVPQFSSSRAKRLQNITNKDSNPQRLLENFKRSPAKDASDLSHNRKTPRKKNHPNTENISPLKCENKISQKASASMDTNSVWKDKLSSSNEKQALDLRKVKVESESKPVGSIFKSATRSTLQRKILFDDVPDDKRSDKLPSRMPLLHTSNHLSSKYLPSPVRNSPMSGAVASCDPLTLSPVDSNGNKEFRTLAPENVKDDVPGSSIVRVQNSQVKSQQMSPVTPSETRILKSPAQRNDKKTDKDQKIVFAKPQAPSAAGSFQRTNTPSSPHCNCVGRLQVCTICLSKKPHNAPRAGTPGFRPPEVLLRSPLQSTAVDMWAVGVILLCVLSGCYPFFRSPDDLTALAEIMTVFGTDKIKETAKRLGRMVVCSQPSQPLDLKKLCIRMRQRRKNKNSGSSSTQNSSSERCTNCCQSIGAVDSCICLKEHIDALSVDPVNVNNKEEADDVFPDSAYHLLARLLDVDADTRITAAQALEHPFVTGL